MTYDLKCFYCLCESPMVTVMERRQDSIGQKNKIKHKNWQLRQDENQIKFDE